MAYRKLTYEPDPLCIKCGHLMSKHTATHTDRPLCLACPEGWCVTAGATSEEITGAIASAIREHDFAAVSSLLKLLAVRDPHRAGGRVRGDAGRTGRARERRTEGRDGKWLSPTAFWSQARGPGLTGGQATARTRPNARASRPAASTPEPVR